MEIILRPSFEKAYNKLSKKLREKIDERLPIFLKKPYAYILHNHELLGEHSGYRSINITGDMRAIFYIKDDVAVFADVGTHSELFGK